MRNVATAHHFTLKRNGLNMRFRNTSKGPLYNITGMWSPLTTAKSIESMLNGYLLPPITKRDTTDQSTPLRHMASRDIGSALVWAILWYGQVAWNRNNVSEGSYWRKLCTDWTIVKGIMIRCTCECCLDWLLTSLLSVRWEIPSFI